jgi:hypothetical protein
MICQLFLICSHRFGKLLLIVVLANADMAKRWSSDLPTSNPQHRGSNLVSDLEVRPEADPVRLGCQCAVGRARNPTRFCPKFIH